MRLRYSLGVLITTIALLGGCKSTLNPNYVVAPSNLQPKTTVYLLSNAYGKVEDKDIFGAVADGINRASGLRAYDYKAGSRTYIRGRKVSTQQQGLKVSYINTVTTDVGRFSSVQFADYLLTINNKGEFTEVNITSPLKLQVKTGKAIFIDVEHFKSSDDVINDLTKISNELSFSIEGTQKFSGEEKSEYSVDAIYNSFSRNLGANFSLKKRTSEVFFNFVVEGLSIDAKISPYRKGSILEYEYIQKYEVKSDGELSTSPEQLSMLDQKIIDYIKQIVNS